MNNSEEKERLGADAAAVDGARSAEPVVTGKHTPGPWTYRDSEITTEDGKTHVVCFGHDYGDYGGIGTSTRATGNDWVSKHNAEADANAYLIAAAPEMYAALKFIADRDDFLFAECSVAEAIVAVAQAAIAKAEGR